MDNDKNTHDHAVPEVIQDKDFIVVYRGLERELCAEVIELFNSDLNDVEQGGETEFFHQNLKITPKTGNVLLFPAGWNYMHCGHTPE